MTLIDKMKKYSKPVVLTSALALATLNGGCGVKRMNLYDTSKHDGTISEYIADYNKNEGMMDAAEAYRENICLEKLAKKEIYYETEADINSNLVGCVNDVRELHKYGWTIGALVVDGAKLLYLYEGIKSSHGGSSSSTPAPTTPDSNTMGPGTVNSSGGNVFSSGIGSGSGTGTRIGSSVNF